MKQDSILITSYDLKRLLIRTLPRLKVITLLLFCLSLFYLLLQRPQYLAKASFKHLDKQNDFSPFAKDFFRELSISSNNVPIYSVMHSNHVLKNAIEKLGMQIVQDPSWHPREFAKRAVSNIVSECGRKPADPDSFCFHNVSFDGEKPLRMHIKPLSAKHFEVLDKQKNILAKGELGKALFLPECAFVLSAFPRSVEQNALYSFRITPWISAVEQAKKKFEVRAHKLDKNVFILYFKHPDRNRASQFLNQVMHCYQEYYRKENEEICETQVAYLEKRQDELIKQFDSALTEHVSYLKNNIAESGCIGFSNELDILAIPQNQFNSKLFDVDLELKRLESLYANGLLSSSEEQKEKKKAAHTPHPQIALKAHLEESDLEEKRLLLRGPDKENRELDCDALTLPSAKALYQQYTEKKDASEASLRERIFLREHLSDPDFELSSLSTFLTDSVSVSLAQNASNIALKIKDGENRTVREQERLKEELDTQKRFFHQHLTHMIELEKLQLNLLSHKIHSLQTQTLHLLDEEKILIKEKIQELNQKMTSLPEKWHRENLLLLKKELGSRIIESMTQLVETKNLNQKLYQVSSKHLDLSFPPLNPYPPHLILFSLCLAFLGCFVFYLFKLCSLLIKGFPVSEENLKYLGFHSCGSLSLRSGNSLEHLADADIATLRSVSYFINSLPQHTCVALLHGNNPDTTASLAELLHFAGKKVLIIHFVFDQKEEGGLFAYLEGQLEKIPLRHGARYDEICAGRAPRYAADMLPLCSELISDLKQKYDYLLLRNHSALKTREAQGFCRVADAAVIGIGEESQEEIFTYRTWAESQGDFRLAFVCYNYV